MVGKKYKQTEEHKRKINTKERNMKISKNNAHYWLGKKQTKEHIAKIVTTRKKNKSYKLYGKGFQKGVRPASYIDGRTKLATMIRTMKKYLEWRSDVFKRDNYHCQCCGEKGYLEAHHIISFIKILRKFQINTFEDARNCEILWDIGNGISYCKECHIQKDHRGKRIIIDEIIACND